MDQDLADEFFEHLEGRTPVEVCGQRHCVNREIAFCAATDLVVSPTYVPDLVNASLDLLIDGAAGIWHLTNGEPLTWAELAMRAADCARLSARSLVCCRSAELDFVAKRPRYSALASSRSMLMPSLASSLARYSTSVS